MKRRLTRRLDLASQATFLLVVSVIFFVVVALDIPIVAGLSRVRCRARLEPGLKAAGRRTLESPATMTASGQTRTTHSAVGGIRRSQNPLPPDSRTQGNPVDTGFRVKVSADWIYVNASVWDSRKRASVVDLHKEDFLLYEDGQLQPIDACLSSETPFHLLLLLDVSASTRRFIQLSREAAIMFSSQLQPQDRLAIMTFSSKTSIVQPFTSNRDEVKATVQEIRSQETTALYDATLAALGAFKGIEGRRTIVIFSDGADNQLLDPTKGSKATFEQVRQAVREADCLIYTVVLLPVEPDPRLERVRYRAKRQLQELADLTGGRSFSPKKPGDLASAYGEIANDLRHIYTLIFTPGGVASPGWHDLRVEVKAREGLITRYRRGYSLSEEPKKGTETEEQQRLPF